MIATDLHPFNIVNNVGFEKFVNPFDPKYVLPANLQSKKNLMKTLYFQGFNKLKQILNEIKYIAITTDSWTSAESYLSVTCHFIDTNSELKTTILSTKPLTKYHTVQNVANA